MSSIVDDVEDALSGVDDFYRGSETVTRGVVCRRSIGACAEDRPTLRDQGSVSLGGR